MNASHATQLCALLFLHHRASFHTPYVHCSTISSSLALLAPSWIICWLAVLFAHACLESQPIDGHFAQSPLILVLY